MLVVLEGWMDDAVYARREDVRGFILKFRMKFVDWLLCLLHEKVRQPILTRGSTF